MTFNYEEIATLVYFDSRDVVERKMQINAILEEDREFLRDYEVVELRLERLVLTELLEKLTEYFPVSKWSDVRTDVNCGVSGFAEHYAEEHAQEYVSDVTWMDRAQSWLFNHVDWEAAADDLKQDYAEVEILGSTFYLRD